jgi:hypothetical protein
MTDAVLNTAIANQTILGQYESSPVEATPLPLPIPNVVPPYVGSNVNTEAYPPPQGSPAASPFHGSAADLMPLASIGATALSNSLNGGGLTGPASVLAAMSIGAFYKNPASGVSEGAVSTQPVSTGKTAVGNPCTKTPPYYGQGVVGANVP